MLKFLSVQFEETIKANELPFFRGAVIEKVGRENDLFHNHVGDKAYLHRYPLIQYKRVQSRPTIVCMGAGVDEIHKIFENQDLTVRLGEREMMLKIHRLDLREFELKASDKMLAYHIQHWVGLNQRNYAHYQTLPTEAEQIVFLEKILTGNILGFAEGAGWHIEVPVVVRILPEIQIHTVRIKDQTLIGFSFMFYTNIFLPHFIGLGGKVALGFGVVGKVKKD